MLEHIRNQLDAFYGYSAFPLRTWSTNEIVRDEILYAQNVDFSWSLKDTRWPFKNQLKSYMVVWKAVGRDACYSARPECRSLVQVSLRRNEPSMVSGWYPTFLRRRKYQIYPSRRCGGQLRVTVEIAQSRHITTSTEFFKEHSRPAWETSEYLEQAQVVEWWVRTPCAPLRLG